MTLSRPDVVALRSCVLQAVRKFFIGRGFIEVETPVRIAVPALELHIDAETSGDHYLRTSPELHMKRLLAQGHDRIFQVGPCFRRGERGAQHSPEFTMLEWYHTGVAYMDVLDEARELLLQVVRVVRQSRDLDYRGTRIDLGGQWDMLTVSDAFIRWAGWDPLVGFDADRFDLDLVGKVEPKFRADCPTVLLDYPAEQAALARLAARGTARVAERWELYIGGLELANAFSELTDAAEQRRRFEECARQRALLGKEVYALDEAFLAALDQGVSPCGGAALGVDRLIMLLADAPCIDDVRALL